MSPAGTSNAKGKPKPRAWRVALSQDRQQKSVSKQRDADGLTVRERAAQARRAEAKKLSKAQKAQRYKELQDLRTEAVKQGLVVHGLDPIEVLQRLIDDATIAYVLEAQANDQLRASDQPVDDRRERALRREAAYYAGLSVQYNLQERQTKVAEQRLQVMVILLQRVLRHPDIDLSPDKVKEIPRLMQQAVATLRQPINQKANKP